MSSTRLSGRKRSARSAAAAVHSPQQRQDVPVTATAPTPAGAPAPTASRHRAEPIQNAAAAAGAPADAKRTKLDVNGRKVSTPHQNDNLDEAQRSSNNDNNSSSNNNSCSSGDSGSTASDSDTDNGDNQDATQRVHKIIRSLNDSYATAGILRAVRMENFLCHKNYEITFKPHINFITGENGSGKSAVLVAIQVGLGARATTTKRGGSLGDLVRLGCNKAVVTCKLANEGMEAYNPDEYGKTISITRTLSKQGYSSYRICDEWGSVMSTNKRVLDDILAHFSIMVSNPCVMMNQDTAKEYLTNSTPESNYDFFMKATLLERVRDEITDARENADKMRSFIANNDSVLKEHRSRVKKCKDDYESARGIETHREQVGTLRRELAWSIYNKAAADLKDVEEHMAKLNAAVEKIANKIAKKEERKTVLEASEVEEQKNFIEHDANMADCTKKLAAANLRVANAKRVKDAASRRLKTLRQSAKEIEGTWTDAKKALDEERETTQQDRQSVEAKRQAQLKKLMQRREAIQAEQNELETILRSDSLAEAQSDVNAFKDHVKELKRNEEALRRKVQELSSSRGASARSVATFGSADINQRIRNVSVQRDFSAPPLGPIGEHIAVRQEFEEYQNVVENQLGFLLDGYLVGSFADQKRIKGMTRGKPGQVVVKKPQNQFYNLPRKTGQYKTVFDALVVKNAWLSNAMVDSTGCERWALAPNRDAARAIAGSTFASNDKLRGVYIQNGDKVAIRNGYRSFVPHYGRQRPQRLGVEGTSSAAYKKKLEAYQRENAAKLRRTLGEQADAERALNQGHVSLKACKQKIAELKRNLRNLNNEINELEDEQAAENEADIGDLEREFRDLTVERDELLASIDAEDKKFEKASTDLIEASAEAKICRTKLDQLEGAFEDKEEKLKGFISEMSSLQRAIDAYGRKMLTIKAEAQGFEEGFAAKREDRDAKLRIAEEIGAGCEPMASRRVAHKINSEIEALEDLIERAEKKFKCTVHELRRRVEEATAAKAQLEEKIKGARENLEVFNNSVHIRERQWASFRKTTVAASQFLFQMNLNLQNHSGQMEVDHDSKRLMLNVSMGSGSASGASKSNSLGGLSGGERSFTTLAFIMALGESMECPIRAMDEFDVFMDDLNRKISLDLMIRVCRNYKSRQFIFISPLGMQEVMSEGKDIAVWELQPPRPDGVNSQRVIGDYMQ